MLSDTFIVDAVAHAYDLRPTNYVDPLAEPFSRGAYGFHTMLTPEGPYRQRSMDSYFEPWSAEDLETLYATETDVDLVVYHGLLLDDYFRDGLSPLAKGVELRDRAPDRVVLYGPINPLELDRALAEIDRLADLGVLGLKLYPARYYNGRSIPVRLDDDSYAVPVIERAIARGIKTIAVHKAMPFGGTRAEHYRVDDIDYAAVRYPEMTFEIVHSGFAFLEDTFMQLGRFENVYANLEMTSSLALVRPRRFAEIIANFLYVGAEDRVMFASGCCVVHPQPIIEALLRFQLPEDMLADGLPALTDDVRRKILGGNFLRMHGLDESALRARFADDDWSRRRGGGRASPYHDKERAIRVEVGS